MENKKVVKVGLIGLGTVGSGVVKALAGFDGVKIEKIAVKNINKRRNIDNFDETLLTDNAFDIVSNPEVDIVVEVIGGINPAKELLETAIKNGKHIVTANKELLAKHGKELFRLANDYNVVILYEAAIAGGIPIIMPIKTTLAGNKIDKVEAIINGTTNYILTKMEEDGVSYETVLQEAQALGYAEADPTGDVEGFDSAYKIATLATICLNQRIDINSVYREGITQIRAKDMEFARAFGYKIKLIALAQLTSDGKADVRVHPMFVPIKNSLASVTGVTNSVVLHGFPVGRVMFSGPGAGEFPTASSVIGDILAISRTFESQGLLGLVKCNHSVDAVHCHIADTCNKYYISITAENTPGVIATIGDICAQNSLSLASILQKGIDAENTAEIVIITEKCKESNISSAMDELEKNSKIVKINSFIRVME